MEMVERVAKALEPMCFGQGNTRLAIARELARAAIEAMRTPTPSMVDAGEAAVDNAIDETSDSYCSYKVYSEDAVAIAAWGAMIDAALTSEPAPSTDQ